MAYATEAEDRGRLRGLIAAGHPLIVIRTADEPYALGVVRAAVAELRREMLLWDHLHGLRRAGVRDEGQPIKESEHPAAALYHLLHEQGSYVAVLLDVIGHLGDAKTLRLLRELVHQADERERAVVLIDHGQELPAVVRAVATVFEPSLPNDEELHKLARETLSRLHRRRRIKIELGRDQWRTVLKNLRGLSRRDAAQVVRDAVAEDRVLDEADMNHVLASKRRLIRRDGLLEYVESPARLDEVGGLESLKRWLALRDGAATEEATAFGLQPPRGVLLLGVQGAGKSMCARAIATAWGRPLLRMDPGALYDRYIGESERRLREALGQAEAMAPVVLWIDEIEKGFASAATRSTDGGLSQRMFGTLLTWMQDHEAPVFLVATANEIEALPPELLRKGRFDEIFFVDLPGPEARAEIFAIHLKRRGRDPERFDVRALAEASEGFSGAEIEQAIVSAMYEAFASKSELSDAHIVEALRQTRPLSVTMAEKMAKLRAWAAERCVPAN